jgi:ATP-dependent helicase/nuclease subunit A
MTSTVADVVRKASHVQLQATDPQKSIWVSASAGTGKTKVLTDRVLSLMLNGTPPARILCLTFTKAAAAEMANRIADRLGLWVSYDDEALRKDLRDLTGAWPSEDRCGQARRLFARVLDAPGGMKIQTIHAFCQSLLKRFPLEADIAPHFEVLDERSAAELMRDARESVLRRARPETDADLAEALAGVTRHVAEGEFDELLRSLASERARLAQLVERFGDVDALARAIFARLGVDPADSVEALRAAACEDAALDLMGLRLAIDALARGSAKTDGPRGAVIAGWLAAAPQQRVDEFERYCSAYLTDKGDIRARLITKAAAQASPGVEDILLSEARRLAELRERLNTVVIARATAALLRLGDAMLASYARHKRARALLDYDDLVLAARDLLQRPGIAPWVLFKLDGGLDHILIDEAQDTNLEQWQVVAALAEEFFAGAGARAEIRTVFAVGDPKQSIFSFQRADPSAFARMRAHFRARVLAAKAEWDDVPLTISFRSAGAVLEAVNAIFAEPAMREGLFLGDGWPTHEPARVGQAGLVELWPPVEPRETPEIEPWSPPIERRGADSPRGRLARLVAHRIATMIAGGDRLESRGRPVEAGDFLILVRRRNALVEELVRELKQRRIAVAGVDRMVLTEQLAVMDLVALGHFLLLPDDQLTLATILKSPFIGFTEEDLYELAEPRGEGNLWTELKRRAADRAVFARACAYLSELLAEADFRPPYELYADILGRRGGRQALLARLGPEAADAIDEFMNLALAFERTHVPSLQGFLHWLESGAVEVKRDLDQESRGQVRIMTVHGAKGLQAPIVILPDTMQTPRHTARILWMADGAGSALPLWSPRTSFDEARAGVARERQRAADMREQCRLLYVALTRAEDRLYICGWRGTQNAPDDCWYHLVHHGFSKVADRLAFDCTDTLGPEGWSGVGYRLFRPQLVAPEAQGKGRAPLADAPALPAWYRRPAPVEPPGARPLTPSRPAQAEPAVRAPIGADEGTRFQRGLLVHRLLQILPDLPREQRQAVCRRFLARPLHALDQSAQEEIAREVLRVLDDPEFAPLFAPGSRAEVPAAGLIEGRGGPLVLSGQIDRLVVTDAAVLIIDYKSNRPPPTQETEVAELYLRQMAAYRAALARVYPDRPIRCALLWTDGPRLMPLSPELLDGYLP